MKTSRSETTLIERLVDEFVQRQRRGEQPSMKEYVQRYPNLADEIREIFPALGVMERVAPAADDLADPSLREPFRASPALKEIGDYRILREIGRGGMGVVYEAEQQSLRRRVALKVLPRELSASARGLERFEREARAAARMHHTNIVPVFDVNREGETAYYAMQLIHGEGLDAVINDLKQLRQQHRSNSHHPRHAAGSECHVSDIAVSLVSGEFPAVDLPGEVENGPSADARRGSSANEKRPAATSWEFAELPTRQASDDHSIGSASLPGSSDISTAELDRSCFHGSVAQIGLQAASALSYAHARGIIHRDIKPSNLIVDASGVVWVTDFGLAKTDEAGMTHTGDILGTMRYMSPERFQGQCDARVDIYSLGLTLYELLVLQPAFPSADRLRLIEMIRMDEPPSPRTIDSRIPRDLETIVLKSMDKDPKRRYQSADELCEDLRRFLEDKTIMARRASLPERLMRWARRNRGIAASLVTIGLLLLMTAIGSSLAARYFLIQRQAAEKARENEQRQTRRAEVALATAERTHYNSQVRLAQLEIERGNLNAARQILLDTPPNHRNWEWGWLVARAWSPPGRKRGMKTLPKQQPGLVASDYWSAAPAQAVMTLDDDNQDRTTGSCFSRDSARMVTAGVDGTLAVWSVETGQRLRELPKLGATITAMAISHDGKRLTAGDTSGRFCLINLATGTSDWNRMPRDESVDDRDVVRGLWFSPDDAHLIVAYGNGLHSVVETKTGQTLHTTAQHKSGACSLRFLNEGRRVISASRDGSIRVWELSTGELVQPVESIELGGHRYVSIVAISPSARDVAVGYANGSIIIWDRRTGEVQAHFVLTGQVHDLEYSHDGSCLFAAAGHEKVYVLNPKGGVLNRFKPLRMAEYGGLLIAANANGSRLATNSNDGMTTIWAPTPKAEQRVLRIAHDGLVLQAAFSRSGHRIVTASFDQNVRVWNARTGKLVTEFAGHDHELLKAAFSPDERRIVSVDCRGNTCVWDARSGKELVSIPADSESFFQSVAGNGGLRGEITNFSAVFSSSPFTPDGKRLVLHDGNGMVVVDVTDGRRLCSLQNCPPVGWPVIGRHGQLAAVLTDTRNEIQLWDVLTGEQVHTLAGHDMQAYWASFNHEGTRVVTSSMDGTALVWDTQTGDPLGIQLTHDRNVMTARFSPDDTRIATASADSTARIWDASTGQLISTHYHGGARLTNVEWKPTDGMRILTTALDNILRVWKTEGSDARPLVEFTREDELVYATWGPHGRQIVTCWGDGSVHLLKALPWEGTGSRPDSVKAQLRRWRALHSAR